MAEEQQVRASSLGERLSAGNSLMVGFERLPGSHLAASAVVALGPGIWPPALEEQLQPRLKGAAPTPGEAQFADQPLPPPGVPLD